MPAFKIADFLLFLVQCQLLFDVILAQREYNDNAYAGIPHVIVPGVGVFIGERTDFAFQVDGFKGIRYAEPPVGSLRWQPPVAISYPYQDFDYLPEIEATEFGASCMQPQALLENDEDEVGTFAEDCLFLNVYKPRHAAMGDNLPVIVFIHGGMFDSGAGRAYYGEGLVSPRGNPTGTNNVIVVTLNYRLNVFGFLGDKAIGATTSDGSSGNFGVQDQRQAIQWVSDNIRYFGGDKEKITLMGHSAGGTSVLNHLVAKTKDGEKPLGSMYRSAIILSGGYTKGAMDEVDAVPIYSEVLAKTGCKRLDAKEEVACLKEIDSLVLADVSRSMTEDYRVMWLPIVDGVVLDGKPHDLIAAGEYNSEVPIVLGSTRDEYALYAMDLLPSNMTEDGFDQSFHSQNLQLNESEISHIKELYTEDAYEYPDEAFNNEDYSLWWWKAMRVESDAIPGLGHCTTRWLSRAFLKGGTPAVFDYMLSHPIQSPMVHQYIEGTSPGIFVPHGADVPFMFPLPFMLRPREIRLVLAFGTYLATFAAEGRPGAPFLPEWPAFTQENDVTLEFSTPALGLFNGDGIDAVAGIRKDACDFMETQLYQRNDLGTKSG